MRDGARACSIAKAPMRWSAKIGHWSGDRTQATVWAIKQRPWPADKVERWAIAAAQPLAAAFAGPAERETVSQYINERLVRRHHALGGGAVQGKTDRPRRGAHRTRLSSIVHVNGIE